MAAVELPGQAHAADLAEWLEQSADLLGRGLEGDVAHDQLCRSVLLRSCSGFLRLCSFAQALAHAELQLQLLPIQQGPLRNRSDLVIMASRASFK